jgi:TolB-like protein/DNA-binding winged helix-turn-helix (wHTH) protein
MLPKDQGVIHFGLFSVDLCAGELYRKGRKVSLQEKPFQILTLLLERPGEVVSREEVRQKLWAQDTFVDFDASVNTAIRKLRAALGDSAENPRFIETLPRHGYRFIAPVNGEIPTNVIETTVPKISQPLRHRLVPVTGIAVVVFLGVTALVGLSIRARRQRLSATIESGRIHSLAVLPLENLTGDPNQNYFVDGMHDALITELGQVGGLRVISRASVMHYKGTKETVAQIAQELKVDAVIEGAVARSGQHVRITAQLIDARNEGHLWAHSYERDLSDVVTLQGQVAQEIAQAAKVELAPKERAVLENPQKVNPEAYDAFLKGERALGFGGADVKGFDEAISYFEESTNKQPDFALAYAHLAVTYYQFSFSGTYAPKEFIPKAEAAARKALELDEKNSEAHFTLAAILFRYQWDWMGAEKEYQRATELPRSLPRPGWVEFLFLTGRAEAALTEAQQEQERDPALAQPKLGVGKALRLAGRYDEAITQLRTVLKEFPRLPPRANHELGVAYVLKGELNQAIPALEKAVELSKAGGLSDGNDRYVAWLGYAYAMAGRTSEARGILRNLRALSQQRYVSPYGIALLHLGLGEKEAALNWLDKAYEAHAFELADISADRRLDPLRSNPRFQDLAQRVGPPPAMLANQTPQR